MERNPYLEKIEFMLKASQTQEDVDVCLILKDVIAEWHDESYEHNGYTNGLDWAIQWLIDRHSI